MCAERATCGALATQIATAAGRRVMGGTGQDRWAPAAGRARGASDLAPCRTTRRGGSSTTPTPTSWRPPTWLRDHADPAVRDRIAAAALPGRQRAAPDRRPGRAAARPRRRLRPARPSATRSDEYRDGRGGGDHAAARTSPPPARSSPRTAPGRSTCSASPASSCSTRSTTAGCATGSTAATSSWPIGAARAHNRGMVEFCSVDPRLLPTLLRARSPTSTGRRALAAEAIEHGRGRAARRVGLPAGPLAQPRRARPGVGAGAGGRHPGRVPRRRHRRPHRPGVLPQRPARSRPTSTAARRTSAPSTTWASPARRRRRWRR